jgi:hypothetical protein
VPPPLSSTAGDFDAALSRLDVSLFETIHSQTALGDKASLLSLELAARERWGSYCYLEIGSHLGGSLQPHVVDPHCRKIVSIDPRPEFAADARTVRVDFHDLSTERMLEQLSRVPGADLEKLETIEASSWDIDPQELSDVPNLCFIDGEHTHDAALADARFCRQAIGDSGCIAFHDDSTVRTALRDFVGELAKERVEFTAYPVPKRIFVVEIGDAGLHLTEAMSRHLAATSVERPPLTRYLALSTANRGLLRRALLRLWLSDYGGARSRSLHLRLRVKRRWKRTRLRAKRRWRRARDRVKPRYRGVKKAARRRGRRVRKGARRSAQTVRKRVLAGLSTLRRGRR